MKKGDRVKLKVDQEDSDAGQIGTLLEDAGDSAWVEFDTPTRWPYNHVDRKGEVMGKAGFCDCIDVEHLEPYLLTCTEVSKVGWYWMKTGDEWEIVSIFQRGSEFAVKEMGGIFPRPLDEYITSLFQGPIPSPEE